MNTENHPHRFRGVFATACLIIASTALVNDAYAVTQPAQAKVDKTNSLDYIVAIVNDDVITSYELQQEMHIIKKQLTAQRTRMPPDDVLRKQVLDRMVVYRIELQLAARSHIQVEDERLNQAIENMAKQNGMSLSGFRDAVQSDGVNFTDYRERVRDEMTISRLQQRQVANRITVSDQEVDEFLSNQNVQESGSEEYHLFHILKVVPEAAGAETIQQVKAQAQGILNELRLGADFQSTAIAKSDGQQALSGGDLGWRKLIELPTLFADLVRRMKPGDVSDLIRSPSGFHIVKLQEIRTVEPKHIVKQTQVRHILIKTSDAQSEKDAEIRAEQLKRRIDSGEDFAELAKVHSDDKASAMEEGNLGWINPGNMVKEFEDAMNGLDEGQVSDPVLSPFGWHIIQVQKRRDFDNTEEYQKNKARDTIRQRKLEPAIANWLRRIRDEAFVEVRL